MIRLTLPYDMRVIKRVDAFFQTTNYVRTATLTLISIAILQVYATPLLIGMMAARVGAIFWQSVLVRRMPDRVGALGLTVVILSTMISGMFYMGGTLILWAQPNGAIRCVAAFALALAMIDTVCARRGDPVLFVVDNLLILLMCCAFPMVSWLQGRGLEEVLLIGTVTMAGFVFYLFGATEVMQTRGALNVAQVRQAEQSKTEALGRLTGGVAHDFNNLLTVIGGNLDLIEQIGDPAERRVLLQEARMATTRAAQVTGQLLAYSRRAAMHPETYDVADSLAELDTLMRRLLPSNIAFSNLCPKPGPLVCLDRGQFDAVLLNLCINARDAITGSGRIVLQAGTRRLPAADLSPDAAALPPGPYVCITVEDDGAGMPPEVLSRVFEPYFTTKAKGQGAGMGLSMARGFAEQSGGSLGIRSRPGAGAVATLILPMATAAALSS